MPEEDPVRLMKKLFTEDKMEEVKETETDIVIGDRSWPKDTKTEFKISSSRKDGTSNYYSLAAMFHLMKSNSMFKYQDRKGIFNFLQDRSRHPNPQATTNINALPDEIVTKILSYLPSNILAKKVPLICRRLRTLSHTPSLWKDLTLSKHYSNHVRKTNVIEKLIPRCTLLRKLELTGQVSGSAEIATQALRRCSRLLELTIELEYRYLFGTSGWGDLSEFFAAVKQSDSLRKLGLTSYWDVQGQFTKNAECLARLTDLSVHAWRDEGLLRGVGVHCRRLEAFRYNHLDDDDDVSFFLHSVKDTIKTVVGRKMAHRGVRDIDQCRLLETLMIPGSEIGGPGLASICRLPNLRVLDLGSCPSITDADVINALRESRIQNLTRLDVSNWEELGDAGLVALVEKCPEIRILSLYGCVKVSYVGVSQVLRKCLHLKELDLRSIPGVRGALPATFSVVNAPLEALTLDRSRVVHQHLEMIMGRLPHFKKLTLL